MDIELLQFPHSHFNEKVRWALDFKGISHTRTDLMPGPHRRRIQTLTGQTATPVLRIRDEYVAGSARIIERLEHDFPAAPRLMPVGAESRSLVLEFQRHFDRVLGPAVRVLVFAAIIDDSSYIPKLFASTQPLAKRMVYRWVFPFMRKLIAKGNGLDRDDAVEQAERLVVDNMATLERYARRGAYLVGGAFSVADLTAAALVAPLVDPNHPDMKLPTPMPASLAALVTRWREHYASRWVLDIYAKHRSREIGVTL